MMKIIQDLIAMLVEFFSTKDKIQPPEPTPRHTRNERLLVFAADEVGTLEWKNGSNPKVEKYHAYAAPNNDQPMDDKIPWCASFICYCLEMVGMGSTNSRAARSFMNWGLPITAPVAGDLAVFWRGSRNGWQGHVGIFLGKASDGSIYVLGGNQADAVNVTLYSTNRLLGYRRSSKMPAMSPGLRDKLENLGWKIINGKKVSLDQKVD